MPPDPGLLGEYSTALSQHRISKHPLRHNLIGEESIEIELILPVIRPKVFEPIGGRVLESIESIEYDVVASANIDRKER